MNKKRSTKRLNKINDQLISKGFEARLINDFSCGLWHIQPGFKKTPRNATIEYDKNIGELFIRTDSSNERAITINKDVISLFIKYVTLCDKEDLYSK